MAVAQDLAIGDAVERHASGEAQIAGAGLGSNSARQTQYDFLGDRLHRGREVHLALGQWRFGCARRAAEQRLETRIGHRQAGAIIEIALVEPKAAIRLHIDQVIEDGLGVTRLAIGGETHHLVFARIDSKTGIGGERRIKQPERMREMDFLQHVEPVAVAVGGRCRRPLADPVHRQHRRFLKRRGKERGGGMALVMLGEQQPLFPIAIRS